MSIRSVRFCRTVCLLAVANVYWVGPSAGYASPEIPGREPGQPVALMGGTIHPVNRPAIQTGTLIFDQGRITAVGPEVPVPPGAARVDVSGKHLYPGLIDAYTNLGLVEINSIRATIDNRETGSINPSVSAQVAVNPDSELIPVTRSNGVLLTLTAPSGGLIAGKSSVLQLDGWTWEDMTLQADVAMHVRWPRMRPVSNWLERRSAAQQSAARDEALGRLRQAFEDARAYQRARRAPRSHHAYDSRWEALLPVLDGRLPVIVHADEVQQIQAAVAFSVERGFSMILHGGYDAPHCAELLKKHGIPVILDGVYRLPRRRSDPYDTPFTLPHRLRQLGIAYCISGGERTSNVRNLPYHAAMAVAFGLPAGEALKAITLYPAQILGVADRVGSLEVGKDATVIVTTGDPLETATHVVAAYVRGRAVDLNDRHKRLWHKYEEKYRRLPAD